MSSRLEKLPLPEDFKRAVRSMGIEDLYDVQARALEHALNGEDLVLSIPTASGKSLVAYLALANAAAVGRKGLYIVPLRALASEKYEDLQAFEPLGIRVGISTGDYDSSDAWLTRYDIVIATSEKTDALMRQRSPFIPEIKVVVADEVHMMNDPKRGPTVEVLLARFKELDAQVIALSATITNAQQIAEWLGARCIYDEWRPVPLREGIYAAGTISYADGGFKSVAKKGDPVCTLVLDTMSEGGQALVFVRTRKVSEGQAKAIKDAVGSTLSEADRKTLIEVAERIRRGGEEGTSLGQELASCVESGVAFHHAGLRDTHRKEIEKAFRTHAIKAVVATTTLAAGVNLPARRVILRDLSR
jgi:helicase